MRIYSIVSIAQLKSEYTLLDSYNKRSNIDLSSVMKNDDIDSNSKSKFYEIETLLKKKISRGKAYYLIK